MKLVPVVEVDRRSVDAFDFENNDPHFFSEDYTSLEAMLLYPQAIPPILESHAKDYKSFEILRDQGDHDTLTSLCGGFTLFRDSQVILEQFSKVLSASSRPADR